MATLNMPNSLMASKGMPTRSHGQHNIPISPHGQAKKSQHRLMVSTGMPTWSHNQHMPIVPLGQHNTPNRLIASANKPTCIVSPARVVAVLVHDDQHVGAWGKGVGGYQQCALETLPGGRQAQLLKRGVQGLHVGADEGGETGLFYEFAKVPNFCLRFSC